MGRRPFVPPVSNHGQEEEEESGNRDGVARGSSSSGSSQQNGATKSYPEGEISTLVGEGKNSSDLSSVQCSLVRGEALS